MRSTKSTPTTIDEYLAAVSGPQRAALEKLRKTIHAAAPGAEEYIGYGLAGFKLKGRPLVYFGAWQNHCAFYPGSPATQEQFKDDLKAFDVSKGTVRFTTDKPLPAALVKRLVRVRIAENAQREHQRKTAQKKA
ncbi:MAG TPA: DUF1801 domain-containing protein [Verrucomicrobiota bacterium]|nr:hypothetical protein [Verrucomicrobiales bacterium]HRI14173.1 DUF1801 domain-containing protein [Verrucomicrobiota bacterium]